MFLQVWGATNSNNIISVTGALTGDICFIVAVDAVNGTAKVFKNGTKFTGSFSGQGTSNSGLADALITARYVSTGTSPLFQWPNNTKFRSSFLIDKYITDTEAADLLAEMKTRHGGGSIYT